MGLPKIIVIVLLIAFLSSCASSDRRVKKVRTYSQLRVAVDTNSNFYLDSIRISADYKHRISNYQQYDSLLKQFVYVFDSVANGKIDLTLVSFLNRTRDKKILLQSDTTIIIKESELNNFNDAKARTLTSLDLRDGDTAVIGLSSLGCFHFLKENFIATKIQGKYYITFNSTRGSSYGIPPIHLNKTFDSSFVHTLNNFYKDCKVLLRRKSGCLSTTTAFVFVRIRNTVYRFPEIGCGDWKGYDNLLKAIDPPWTKKNAS
jgi:hypothetical protein